MSNNLLLAVFIVLMSAIVLVIVLATLSNIRNKKALKAKIETKLNQLRQLYNREQVFLCFYFEVVDNNLFQLWGESLNIPVRSGMKIVLGGTEHLIKEVYADDETQETPDKEVAAGAKNVTIVVEKGSWDWSNLERKINSELAVPLKLI